MVRTAERAWSATLAVAYGIIGVTLLPPNPVSQHPWWATSFLVAAVLAVTLVCCPGRHWLRIAMVCVGSLATLSRVGLLMFAAPHLEVESRVIGATVWATFALLVVMNAAVFMALEEDEWTR